MCSDIVTYIPEGEGVLILYLDAEEGFCLLSCLSVEDVLCLTAFPPPVLAVDEG